KTVKEWKARGYELADERMSTKVTGGMAIMGPKIGSFWGNLNGDFTTLTADLWFSRTWNRYTGNMQMSKDITENKAELLQALKKENRRKYLLGYSKTQLKTDDAMFLEWVYKASKAYAATKHSDKADIWVQANTIKKKLDGNLYDAPRNGSEREAMREAAVLAQELLIGKGYGKIDIADIQAILWYNEKDLFSQYKAVSEKAEKQDYETVAQAIVGEAGIENGVALQFQRDGDRGVPPRKSED
ncbi:unnamed protein product, partial [marine sediment metagenome]